MADSTEAGPRVAGQSYRQRAMADWGRLGIWDYLRYDEAGDLWIGQLRVKDALARYGSPLEIVDTSIVEARSRQWMELTRAIAAETGYPGRLDYLYASKANMAAEMTHAAYRSGWSAETSSVQDLEHLQWMRDRDLLPEGLRVVCNGFKLPAERHGFPSQVPPPSESDVELPDLDPSLRELSDARHAPIYAETIRRMAAEGWDITPIFDADELDGFLATDLPRMKVGLRMKLGQVSGESELARHVSRFGLDREALVAEAGRIAAAEHLELTTLHAMVGAAETIPVERFVDGLMLGAERWIELRREHPGLRELNLGGGIPPLGEDYDHAGFLRRLMRRIAERCREAGLPAPDLTFELGSLVAAEAGFHVFKVIQRKRNHVSADGGPGRPWALLDGGLMAAIPDMLLIDKPFRFLAVAGADAPAVAVRFGDPSCDSDGRYPPESFGADAAAWLPDIPEDRSETHVCIQGVGAYQEILSGVRGAHHCGLLEAIELIVERNAEGRLRGRLMPRQTSTEAARVLGYTEDSASVLARTLGKRSERRTPKKEPRSAR